MKPRLSKLDQVELRDVWESESSDFTPWLAQDENIALLGEVLGLELEVEAAEKDVGPFRADILCRDANSERWVLIENQLETTDHNHLGQLLTYAAGLKALTVVWIARKFTEEHRAALDWLNEITDDKIHFFGIEVQIWRIGNSECAPRFSIVAKPNNWSSQVSQAASKVSLENLSETRQLQLEYWRAFAEYLSKQSKVIHPQTPAPRYYMNIAMGHSGVHLYASIRAREDWIAVGLYLKGPAAKRRYDCLLMRKNAIEKQLGEKLEWLELPDRIASAIELSLNQVRIADRGEWNSQHTWLKTKLERFYDVFKPALKALLSENDEV